jgi:hypothetical protein
VTVRVETPIGTVKASVPDVPYVAVAVTAARAGLTAAMSE